MKRYLALALALVVGVGPLIADVTIQSTNTPVGAISAPSVTATGAVSGGTVVATTSVTGATLVGTTSLTVGSATPTAITNIRVYSPTCTSGASTAAIQTHSFACSVVGITTADKVLVNPPGNTSLCPLVNARASAADTVTLAFSVLTAAACTPLSGVYTVVAFRS